MKQTVTNSRPSAVTGVSLPSLTGIKKMSSGRKSDARSRMGNDDDFPVVQLKSRPTRRRAKQQLGRAKRSSSSLLRSFASLFGLSPKEREPAFDTLGGVFAEDLACDDEASFSNDMSTSTLNTGFSVDSQWSEWSSSGGEDHLANGPRFGRSSASLVTKSSTSERSLHLSEHELWGRLMLRARKLPKQSVNFENNHIMINSERTKRFTPALCRSRELDALAQEHAKKMAESSTLSHATTDSVLERGGPTSRVATNVARGSTLKAIHTGLMQSTPDKNNILDSHFSYMGIGTAKATDGTLYLCQLFQS